MNGWSIGQVIALVAIVLGIIMGGAILSCWEPNVPVKTIARKAMGRLGELLATVIAACLKVAIALGAIVLLLLLLFLLIKLVKFIWYF